MIDDPWSPFLGCWGRYVERQGWLTVGSAVG